MKAILSLFVLVFSFSVFAQFSQDVIIGKKAKNVDICEYKSGSGLEGSAYFHIVGRCAWDPAMNGMYLTLTVVSEDPTEKAYEVDLGQNVLSITKVTATKTTIKVAVVQETMTTAGNIVKKNKVITVVPQKADNKFTVAFKITTK